MATSVYSGCSFVRLSHHLTPTPWGMPEHRSGPCSVLVTGCPGCCHTWELWVESRWLLLPDQPYLRGEGEPVDGFLSPSLWFSNEQIFFFKD